MKIKTIAFLMLFSLMAMATLHAQNVTITDDSTHNAHSSSMLDVYSVSKGFLMPRLTTTQRTGIAYPATGLIVFDTDSSNFFFYNGSAWVNLLTLANIAAISDTIWKEDVANKYVRLNNSINRVGVGVNNPDGKMEVWGDSIHNATDTIPLFAVKDKDGNDVFVVYPRGVMVYVDTITDTSGYKDNVTTSVTGFRVGKKTGAGSKGFDDEYFTISPAGNVDTLGSQARILWYPLKEAFLSGRVIVESPDSVGYNSWASGYLSKSIGDYSQALGYSPKAVGNYSTAIGNYALALGDNSFALGDSTIAGGGGGNKAASNNCYAFGKGSEATGEGSYAFGYKAIASGQDAFAIGTGTEASGLGSFALGYIGRDSANISTGNTKATAEWAFAMGMGSQSTYKGAFAMGTQCLSQQDYSLSMGYKSVASGTNSISIGKENVSSGNASIAYGYKTIASGDYSTSIGWLTKASHNNATAIGQSAHATGYGSIAMGDALASGNNSIAIGASALASNSYCTAIGYNTLAQGWYSTALGNGAFANGNYATAIGNETRANGNYSVAIGDCSRTYGISSYASGSYSVTYGYASTAMGLSTRASGNYSTSLGYYTTAYPFASLVIGRYNLISGDSATWVNSDPLFVIGNGTSSTSRSNALTVLKNGCIGIQSITSPTYALQLPNSSTAAVGQARAYAWTAYSDGRLKNKREEMPYGLNEIMQLQPLKYFHHNSSVKNNTINIEENGKFDIGLIAQDVYKIIPEIVAVPENETIDLWGINYEKLTPVLIKAIQEQQLQIEKLKAENEEMKKLVLRIDELNEKYDALIQQSSASAEK